jgi:hypothetical protein
MVKIVQALELLFVKSWWVILFSLGCYMFYEQGMRRRDVEYDLLHRQWTTLEEDKRHLLTVQENLLLKINSQSDPAYVELTLMKGLGLVPEGQKKVLFTKSDEHPERS